MNIKVKHIIPIIITLFLIYVNYNAIKFVFFELHTVEESSDSAYPPFLGFEIFFLGVLIVHTICTNWNKTLLNTNKIKSQITNKLK